MISIRLQLLLELGGVKLAIAPTSLDDLGLLLDRKVLPGEVGPNNFLEQRQNLVMADGTGIGEVVDASVFMLGHQDRCREQIGQDAVAVRDIYHPVILADLGHKVAWV